MKTCGVLNCARMALGETVVRLRKSRRLSQEELASAMKVSRATIQNIEGDKKVPQGSTIRELARALGLSLEEFDAEVEKDDGSVQMIAGIVKGRGAGPSNAQHRLPVTESLDLLDAPCEDDGMSTFDGVSAGALSSRDIDKLVHGLGPGGRFRVRVRGDSMDDGTHAGYPSGCSVVFSRPAALGEGLVYGKDYLVWTDAEEATFKRLGKDRDPNQYLLLTALNSERDKYPDARVHRQSVLYVARAVRMEMDRK